MLIHFTSCEKDEVTYSFKEKEILRLINEHRTQEGLSTLEMHPVIYTVAKEHSENMAKGLVLFGHDGYYDRYNEIKNNLPNVTGGAENILYGADTPQAVVQGWLMSSGHKANIEGYYTLTGIASAEDKDGNLFYTQIFIRTEKN
ncbi:MAG: CAP domain-containing protein [Bacteroidota bacterium]